MPIILPPRRTVETVSAAQDYLARYLSKQRIVAVDTEFNPDKRIVVWSTSNGQFRDVIWGGKVLEVFRDWLADPGALKICHSAPAELESFKVSLDVEMRGLAADTLMMAFYKDENRLKSLDGSPFGLKSLSFYEFGYRQREFEEVCYLPRSFVKQLKKGPKVYTKKVFCPLEEVLAENREEFLNYAADDAWCTWRLFWKFKPLLIAENLWDYYKEVELPFTITLWKMQRRGIKVDRAFLVDLERTLRVKKARLFRRFCLETQIRTINLRSPKQKGALFFDKLDYPIVALTKTQNPSLGAEALAIYAEMGLEPAQTLHDFTLQSTLHTNFTLPLLAGLLPGDIATTLFVQNAAVTGRISSRKRRETTPEGKEVKVGMQLQNIPARKEKDPYRIRKAFIQRPGWKLICADYSQLELCILAHMSGDPTMIEAYTSDPPKDLHAMTAAAWLQKPVEEVTKEERTAGKTTNFAMAYGATAWTIAKRLGIPEEDAKDIVDAFFDTYPGVKKWVEKTIRRAKKTGRVETIGGRWRRLPKINLDLRYAIDKEEQRTMAKQKGHAERQAINTPIQGSAADLMKEAMNQIERDRLLKKLRYRMLLQVHDEILGEAPEATAEQAAKRVKEIMEGVRKGELKVPLRVDPGVGANWEEAKT